MSDSIFFNPTSVYGAIQITIQIVTLLSTLVITATSIFWKKTKPGDPIYILYFVSVVTQILYLYYFNCGQFILFIDYAKGVFLFLSLTMKGYCELEFIKVIIVLSNIKKRTVQIIQVIWILWFVVIIFIPITVTLVMIANNNAPPISLTIRDLGLVVFNVIGVLFEIVLASFSAVKIQKYIVFKFSKSEEDVEKYILAKSNFVKLKWFSYMIILNSILCTMLYMGYYYIPDPYLNRLSVNLSQILIHITTAIIGYRIIFAQRCIFPQETSSNSGSNRKRTSEPVRPSITVGTMAATKIITEKNESQK
ncbi:hypothetical protein HDV04_000973 [Boothiomyces sp. JEL0838]|nr:hypothetical protein HDV04_000973 [Boothiomyces sp. JEL0838]